MQTNELILVPLFELFFIVTIVAENESSLLQYVQTTTDSNVYDYRYRYIRPKSLLLSFCLFNHMQKVFLKCLLWN